MAAIFFPRRLAMLEQAAAKSRGPPGGLRGRVHDPPQPRRALPGDVPVPDFEVRAPHRRGQPGPAGQLAGAAEPGDAADLGHHDQGGELPDAGQRPEHRDPRVAPGVLVQPAVDPADDRSQAADDRQAAGDDLPRHRRQVQPGQPAAARAGPVAGGPVIAMAGGDRVDPVALPGTDPDQAGPVPQQRPELAHPRRGYPRLGQQAGAQQLRQDRGAGPLSFFSRAEAIALHRSGCTRCGSNP